MKKIALPIAFALAACGGSGASNTADYRANAVTFDQVAISQNDADQVPPAQGAYDSTSEDVSAVACHPHLFQRTGEVISRVNRHFFKLLAHVDDLIAGNPASSSGNTRTWENVRNGIDRKLTITATDNPDGSTTYDFELDLKTAGSTGDFVKVAFGSLNHSGAPAASVTDAVSTRIENKGAATFDFTALATVNTSERARGQITDAFDNVRDPAHGAKRSATLTLTNFMPDDDDGHGPRSGSYLWEREPGTGGKFQFQESVVLFCPSNPNSLAADMTTVARWYKAQDNSVHGRSDSKATGGQMQAGQTWLGVTCAHGQTTAAPAEGYWLMKLEDASGATVSGQADTNGGTPCDAAFGAVPNLTDNSTDYDFSAAVTFPNEWQ
jgi:hypothetical protein